MKFKFIKSSMVFFVLVFFLSFINSDILIQNNKFSLSSRVIRAGNIEIDLENAVQEIEDFWEPIPLDVIAEQGYYVFSEISKGKKLISFDWGGVLSTLVESKDKKIRDNIKNMLSALQDAGMKMIIVSEGGRQNILKRLEDLGLAQYFNFGKVYRSYPLELVSMDPTKTKSEVIKKVVRENGFDISEVVHFDDTPAILKRLMYSNISTVGVVGMTVENDDFENLAYNLQTEAFPNAIVSYLGIGTDVILNILNIQKKEQVNTD